MRPVRVTICGLLPKPDIGGFCSEGPLRAQPVNSTFLLRALAADKLLRMHWQRRCLAAGKPAFRSERSCLFLLFYTGGGALS